jgi:hypothetical protein
MTAKRLSAAWSEETWLTENCILWPSVPGRGRVVNRPRTPELQGLRESARNGGRGVVPENLRLPTVFAETLGLN